MDVLIFVPVLPAIMLPTMLMLELAASDSMECLWRKAFHDMKVLPVMFHCEHTVNLSAE